MVCGLTVSTGILYPSSQFTSQLVIVTLVIIFLQKVPKKSPTYRNGQLDCVNFANGHLSGLIG